MPDADQLAVRFTMQRIKRANRTYQQFMVADSQSGDFAIFNNMKAAGARTLLLNADKARFCTDCGRWILAVDAKGNVDPDDCLPCAGVMTEATDGQA